MAYGDQLIKKATVMEITILSVLFLALICLAKAGSSVPCGIEVFWIYLRKTAIKLSDLIGLHSFAVY